MKIAVDEFDGKVVYGAKRKDTGSGMIAASTTYNVKNLALLHLNSFMNQFSPV